MESFTWLRITLLKTNTSRDEQSGFFSPLNKFLFCVKWTVKKCVYLLNFISPTPLEIWPFLSSSLRYVWIYLVHLAHGKMTCGNISDHSESSDIARLTNSTACTAWKYTWYDRSNCREREYLISDCFKGICDTLVMRCMTARLIYCEKTVINGNVLAKISIRGRESCQEYLQKPQHNFTILRRKNNPYRGITYSLLSAASLKLWHFFRSSRAMTVIYQDYVNNKKYLQNSRIH